MISEDLKNRVKRVKNESDPAEITRTRDALEWELVYIETYRRCIKYQDPAPTFEHAKNEISKAIAYCDSQLQKLGYVYDSHRGRLSRR
jgi:hypothetical protein